MKTIFANVDNEQPFFTLIKMVNNLSEGDTLEVDCFNIFDLFKTRLQTKFYKSNLDIPEGVDATYIFVPGYFKGVQPYYYYSSRTVSIDENINKICEKFQLRCYRYDYKQTLEFLKL